MTAEKPDPRLIATRDWARSRLTWKPGKPALRCREITFMCSPPIPARHARCDDPSCGCDCHAVTDADRQLWQRLADEIDAYLEHPAATSEPEGLV